MPKLLSALGVAISVPVTDMDGHSKASNVSKWTHIRPMGIIVITAMRKWYTSGMIKRISK